MRKNWILSRSTPEFNIYENKNYEIYYPHSNGTRSSIKIHISEKKTNSKGTHVTFEIVKFNPNSTVNETKLYYYPYTNAFTYDLNDPHKKKITQLLVKAWKDFNRV